MLLNISTPGIEFDNRTFSGEVFTERRTQNIIKNARRGVRKLTKSHEQIQFPRTTFCNFHGTYPTKIKTQKYLNSVFGEQIHLHISESPAHIRLLLETSGAYWFER